jgi:hypothetical protein
MEQFKIRCSAIGEIMANDKSGKNMGKTAQTYCKMWVKEQLYNRKKQINSKYLTKGIECESESIDYINGLF